ncbi:hypothetical protein [Marinirhabdus gelatinilytica]|uniref:Thrombospondin type 3 repeat-containing protein n=1 Tax=Marinirhabdus gelatinilytica TaxID=1703343 RepID=A0A370Q530_9FLAO|nr:hypothetical protein [Marinirhabdus gelatinilytica]RDK83481.1 hypothetical protein C8D94_10718 [Marinirhabdus gelatinilytica]
MRRICALLLLVFTLNSCDDGDVIVTSFDFEDANLQFCQGADGFVFFKINEASSESLSLVLQLDEETFSQSDAIEVPLSTSNVMNYRTFETAPTSNYFCNSIPPTSPSVLQDYVATDGTANLNIISDFDDNDGIEEDTDSDLDTDNDGLLNYYDFDDDGDNVPTGVEIGPDPENPLNTDGDDKPDYLDEDDDNDGVPTRHEITKDDPDPQNKITDPNVGADYLNDAVTEEVVYEQFIEHSYSFTTSLELFMTNVVFTNGEEQLTQESLNMGTIGTISSGTTPVTPDFPEQ